LDLNDDVALLDKFRETKDPAIFKSLVRPFQDRIYNAAYRILGSAEEAEEVVQDTYIKVHQGIDKFNKSSSFAAWVFRIAHNSCLDTIRFRQRKRSLQTLAFDPLAAPEGDGADGTSQVVSQAADPGPGPAELLDKDEQGKFIAAKLNELPDSQRAVLVLHDIEGFSYQEIADIVGEKIGTVRSRLHYGRLKLRELLEPYYSSNSVSHASR
jgi:RNA polymerase sigma-70 factor (ECF subfamily)